MIGHQACAVEALPLALALRFFWLLRTEAASWKIGRQIRSNKPVGD